MKASIRFAIGALVATAPLFGGAARADATNHISWSSAGGVLTITADAGWHLNTDYPGWALTVGSTTIKGASFQSLTQTGAVVKATPGSATLKGAVCSADGSSCASINPTLTIN